MISFQFDEEKAIAATLYVAHSLLGKETRPDLYKILKVFYFADQKHIAKYGRPILGDWYAAMKDGPVPSNLYDILKSARGDGWCRNRQCYQAFFSVQGDNVMPLQGPDMDEIAESEVECLELAIMDNKDLDFGELKKKSHDAAYDRAHKNNKISFRDIAKVSGTSPEMIAYMEELAENMGILSGSQAR